MTRPLPRRSADALIDTAPSQPAVPRRALLRGAAALPWVAAAVAAGPEPSEAAPPEAEAPPDTSRGYHVTDHVRWYYDLAGY